MSATKQEKSWITARTVIGVAFLGAVVALVASGAFRGLDGPTLRTLIRDSGALGPVAFVAGFAALQPFGFSAHLFVISAGMIWDPPLALGLSWLGSMGATCTAFWFARWIGREWVQARLPERLHAYDERLAAHGLRTVIVLRLIFYTFAPMQLMLGVSRLRFRDALVGSAFGVIPMLVVEITMGASLLAWLDLPG